MRSLLKNKKGFAFLPLLSIPALIIIGFFLLIVIVGILIFTSINKFAIIGGGAIALVLIFGLRGNMNKTKAWFMGIVIVSGLIFIFASGTLQQFTGENYVNVPTFGYYKCEPGNEKVSTTPKSISSSGSGFLACPENSDQCDVKMRIPQTSFGSNILSDYRAVIQVCKKDGSYCSPQVPYNIQNFKNDAGYVEGTMKTNMLKSEKIYIDYQKKTFLGKWNGISGSEYIFNYVPFIIYKYDTFSSRNGQPITNENEGCVIQETRNLVVSASFDLGGSNTADRLRDLDPYETRTFASKFIPISVENYGFMTYSGQDAYCIDGEVYKIEDITTGSGNYKIVGTSENKLLGRETCCPGEEKPGYYCNDNFDWIKIQDDPIIEDVVCSAFKSCPNSQFQPYDSTTLVRFTCEDNQCVQDLKEVECTTNIECGTGQVCSKLDWECVEVKGGDVLDNIPGSELACKTYEVIRYENDVIKKWYNYLGVGEPTIVTNPVCKTAGWLYGLMVAFVVLVLGIVAIIFRPKNKKKKKK